MRVRVEWRLCVFYRKHFYKRWFVNGVVNEISQLQVSHVCVCVYIYIYIRKVVKYAFMPIKGKLGWRALPSRRKLEGSEENESFEMDKSETLNCPSFFFLLLIYNYKFHRFCSKIINYRIKILEEIRRSDIFFFFHKIYLLSWEWKWNSREREWSWHLKKNGSRASGFLAKRWTSFWIATNNNNNNNNKSEWYIIVDA